MTDEERQPASQPNLDDEKSRPPMHLKAYRSNLEVWSIYNLDDCGMTSMILGDRWDIDKTTTRSLGPTREKGKLHFGEPRVIYY